jgi:hypothetical protein
MRNSYIQAKGKAYDLLIKSHPENNFSLSEAFCAGYIAAEEDLLDSTNKPLVEFVSRAMMETVFQEIDVATASLDWTGNDVWGCDFEAMSIAAINAIKARSYE